ncbi:MAG: thiamine pyrophosphate-binding protein, partial [Prochlorococcaceae cyanobacterium]
MALLLALLEGGLERLVLCPGSRSGPLAAAAGVLQRRGVLRLHTAIDERSAAFFALGLGRASGRPAAVITTSGTAVANLLPAAVEADFGAIPLLLLTADRPARLKGCGANQTVNQERFLLASVRWLGEGHPAGLAAMADEDLRALAQRALATCAGDGGTSAPGAVHLNLPFEEPLHAASADLEALGGAAAPSPAPAAVVRTTPPLAPPPQATEPATCSGLGGLGPHRPGLV